MRKIQGFEEHVVLYAKHWYKRTKDPIRDLKKLLSHYCGMELKDIRTNDIYGFLISAFLNTMSDKTNTCVYSDAITEMLGKRWGRKGSLKDRKPVHVLLGNISICDGDYANMNKLFKEFAIDDMQACWDANPTIQGSTNPADFKVVN